MTAAPTAGALLRELDRRQYQAHLSALGDVADADREAVTRALKQVPRNARVDVAILIETLQKEAAARAEAKAARQPDVLGILNYQMSLISKGELTGLRDGLRARVEAGQGDQPFAPGSAGASIMSRLDSIRSRLADVEPDPDLDDDYEDAKPRRGVPRIRSRRVAGESPVQAGTSTPPRPRTRVNGAPRASAHLLFGRAFDAYGDITPHEPDFPPPWLIADDEAERETASA